MERLYTSITGRDFWKNIVVGKGGIVEVQDQGKPVYVGRRPNNHRDGISPGNSRTYALEGCGSFVSARLLGLRLVGSNVEVIPLSNHEHIRYFVRRWYEEEGEFGLEEIGNGQWTRVSILGRPSDLFVEITRDGGVDTIELQNVGSGKGSKTLRLVNYKYNFHEGRDVEAVSRDTIWK